ncbi:glycosyltransferase family 4 protein [Mucilaginibacter sp. cycad4]|uniref:glycosyltransferase family 4 protein n=1 Tax=Mucilaginibacter sp. cycad4 TaxID=3342096 RepID=UPI002AAB5677|nr:glycosyltransferase family 4 protein [Mucilaginibacter gossypii]WPV02476.1 glycosyltransferase family 4 protein [Mucilaginibacter gossypii]
MNILYLCDEYPPGPHGGIGTYVRLIAGQMVKLGHKVIVAGLYSRGYGGADEFEDEGVKVLRYRWGIDDRWFENQRSAGVRMLNRILLDTGITQRDIKRSLAAYQKKLEHIITIEQIDIIEMPDYNDYIRFCKTYVPFLALPVPLVVKLHGSITYFNTEAGITIAPHVLKMEQDILNRAAAVSSASAYTAGKSADYLSYNKPITVLYNGIDTSIATGGSNVRGAKQVVFTGSLVQKKGVFQLAEAWNIVIKQVPDARLLILGKGPVNKVTARLHKDAKSSVEFKGHVERDELYNCLNNSAVAVFPSYAEAFALAPLEAMACGTAVINSNRTSGPELVDDDVNGLLVDPDDVEQLASAIITLLNEPEKRLRLALAGNEKVKRCFDIDIVARQTLQFYQQVLDK